jgi:hypothetical protein
MTGWFMIGWFMIGILVSMHTAGVILLHMGHGV